MKIRGYCTWHNMPLQSASGRIVFPTTYKGNMDWQDLEASKPAQDENGWLDLDQSEMNCPLQTEVCNQEWVWQIQS